MAIAEFVEEQTGIDVYRLARDYHMFQGMRGLAADYPPGPFRTNPDADEPDGVWVFTGGTSLTSAHRLCDRYSEDIDIVFIPGAEMSKSRNRKVRRRLRESVMAGITSSGVQAVNVPGGGGDVTVMNVTVDDRPEFLKFDISHMAPDDWGVEIRQAGPLMGRFATDEELARYPDLARFGVLAMSPVVIAVNKMLALTRLAETGLAGKLRERVRDLYDIHRIASDPVIAARIRADVEALATALTSGGVQREHKEARPEGGFSRSPAFTPGTDAHETLRRAYDDLLPGLVFHNAVLPTFEETIAVIHTLDPG